jgi:hypothetical protein
MKTFAFQNKKQKNYFEGWYVRFTDTDCDVKIAIIFAITKDVNDPHAFIQYYDNEEFENHYYRFDTSAFSYDSDTQTIRIGENVLSPNQVIVKTEKLDIKGQFLDVVPLQKYQGTTSAMGFLSHAPLECFQEVIFVDSSARFTINNLTYNGRSYMEKTYGTNFPKKWIWLQSNHSTNGSAISFSVGHVPVIKFYVKGFFLLLLIKGKEYRFGSFNFSRIIIEQSSESETTIRIKRGWTTVELNAVTDEPVTLVGPRKNGIMDLDVHESITATATIKLYKRGKLIFEDTYTEVGLELMYQ